MKVDSKQRKRVQDEKPNSFMKGVKAKLKGCGLYVFTGLFCMPKREHVWNKENGFYVTSKALLVLKIIRFLIVQKFRCRDVIKCLSIKHETHFTG